MKLYFSPGACSLAPIILAEWLDISLDVEQVNLKDPSEEFLAANPLGAVPALVLDDGTNITQVDAILGYFMDLRPEGGLDAGYSIMDRAELHRWQAFLTGDYHPPFGTWFNPGRFTTDHSDEGLKAVRDATEQRIKRVADELEAHIGDSEHIVLNRRTFIDAYAFAMLRWLKNLEKDLEPWPNIARFLAAMEQDEGVRTALGRERSGA